MTMEPEGTETTDVCAQVRAAMSATKSDPVESSVESRKSLSKALGSREKLHELLRQWDASCVLTNTQYVYFPVKPQAKQSARFGKFGISADPKKKAYVGNLSAHAASIWGDKAIISGPVALSILYCFPWTRTQCKAGFPESKIWDFYLPVPDLDNLSKPCKDALKGIVYVDDSQVVESCSRKIRWADAGILIQISEITAKPIDFS